MASFTFTQVYEGTPSSFSEEANQLSSVSLPFPAGSVFKFESADPNAPFFSGNNVSGNLIVRRPDGTSQPIFGVVSRLFKTGSTVEGMYFYVSGDGTIGNGATDPNEKAYAFVLNPNYFAVGGSYRTSSDPVDTALNAQIVPNSAPDAANDSVTTPENTPVSGNVLANDTDANLDTLSVMQFAVDTDGNGTAETFSVSATPQMITGVGTIAIASNGAYTFTPDSGFSGAVPTITYTASDGTATATATLLITVTPINDPPTSTNDTKAVNSGVKTVLTTDDFGTYADPDGDAWAAVKITTLPNSGLLEYFNGVAWVSVVDDQVVSVADISAGRLRFTAAASTTPSLQFQVSDGTNFSTDYTLDFTVTTAANQAPVAVPDVNTVTLAVSNTAQGNVLPNDSDPDGSNGDLVVSLASGGSALGAGGATIVTVPSGGAAITANDELPTYTTFSVTWANSSANARPPGGAVLTLSGTGIPTGTTATIASSSSNTDTIVVDGLRLTSYSSVTFTWSDGTPRSATRDMSLGTSISTRVIAVTNAANTLAVGMSVTGTGISSGTTIASIKDDGTYRLVELSQPYSGSTPTDVEFQQSSSASITGTYGTLALQSNGTYTYTVNNAVADGSVDVFTYEIQDAAGATASTTLTITILQANAAPINQLSGPFAVDQGAAIPIAGLSVSDVNQNLTIVTLSVSIVSGGTISVTALQANQVSGNGSGSVTVTGTQDEINAVLATLVYTSNASFAGAATLTVTSTDNDGLQDTDAYTIDVLAAPTVIGTTVNEASSHVYFSVNGAPGQAVTLALSSGTATLGGDFLVNLQYYNGTLWVAYTGAAVNIPANGSLLVRTPLVQDKTVEGSESLFLNATNVAGVLNSGQSNIIDDGTGTLFSGVVTNGALEVSTGTLDDDRPLTVSSESVNEASPFTIFSIGGAVGQKVASLTLTPGTATAGTASGGDDFGTTLEYFDGSNWTAFTANAAIPGNGVLFVRLPVFNDGAINTGPYEGAQTFALIAANTGGGTFSGTGVVRDDGTGDVFLGTNTTGTPDVNQPLDRDSAVVVTTLTPVVNEASPHAFFSVVGTAAVPLMLGVNDLTTQLNLSDAQQATIEYSADGVSWTTYTYNESTGIGNKPTPADDGSGKGTVYVRVTISNEQDSPAVFEDSETFELVATTIATGSITQSDSDSAAIVDDGTGDLYSGNISSGVPQTGSGTIDDDRPTFSIDDVTVNEAAGTITFTVTKTGTTTHSATVSYATTDGTATAGSDYTATSNTLTFAAGETTKTIVVTIADDNVFEGSETFDVLLSGATNARITDGTGVGTILDDGTGGDDDGDATDNASDTAQSDDRPTFSINDVTVNEAAGTITFTVTKTGTTNLASSVDYSFASGTATTGGSGAANDYTATAGTLNFAAGDTSKTITVTINQDTVFEGSESFDVDLANATNATIGDAQGVGTILDDGTGTGGSDDDRPTFSINDVTVNEAAGTITFTVTKTGTTTQSATVSYATADGTATAGSDYTTTSDTLTFAAGETTKTIVVSITDDNVFEGSETFNVTLSGATNARIVDGTGVGTLLDDGTGGDDDGDNTDNASDTAQSDDRPTFSINDVTVNEAAGTITFTVTKTGTTTQSATVSYATADGTATAGSDYTAASDTLTFAAGETTKTIVISITDDNVFEGSETFDVLLSGAINARIVDGTGIGTLLDDGTGGDDDGDATDNASDTAQSDDRPTFSINDVTVNEAAGTITFTVTKTGTTTQSATVSYTTADGTATAGSDYTAATGTLTFAAGETTKTITVTITDDSVFEGSETFDVLLSGATNARIADGIGIGTLLDDGTGGDDDGDATDNASDTAQSDDRPTFSINDVTVNEAAGTITFTVTKTGTTTQSATVSYATTDGTATAGSDYTATAGTLTFAAGEMTKTIVVTITDDNVFEGSETFDVLLSGATNARIVDGTGVGTLLDDGTGGDDDGDNTDNASDTAQDDDRPTFSINDVTVNEAAGTITFTVTKAGTTTQSATVSYATADGTATAGSDYTATTGTLTFAAGETTKTIVVSITDDSVFEGSETFNVLLSNATNALIVDGTGVGTILDDGTGGDDDGDNTDDASDSAKSDDRPTFSINDVTVNEAAGTITFTVTKTGTTTLSATVSYATADGTATAGSDYTATSDTLTFAAGETTKTIVVSITDDSVFAGSETFEVNLSGATNARIVDGIGVGTLLDDGTGGDDDGDNTDNASDTAQSDDRPTFSINDVTVNEAAGTITFTVTKTGTTTQSATVSYATTDGTASAGSDYTTTSDTLTFATGETTKTIIVTITDDSVFEISESFDVNLSNSTNATISDVTGVGTILDDDLSNGGPVFTDSGNTPVSSYTFTHAENRRTTDVLGRVYATDADGDSLTFSITQNVSIDDGNGGTTDAYAINPTNGEITLTAAGVASFTNDFETTGNSHQITVAVSDGSAPATTVQVTLTETNEDDNNPIFTDSSNTPVSSYTFTYAENRSTNDVVGRVYATDADGDSLTFSITQNVAVDDGNGGTTDAYAIDSTTGEITLTAAGVAAFTNDFETTGNSHQITVSVSDGSAPATTVQVTLSETNLDDNNPIFTDSSGTAVLAYTFSYAENRSTSDVLGQVYASDADGDSLTFSITSNVSVDDGNGGTTDAYAIDSTTGEITLTAAGVAAFTNDFETTGNSHQITVAVSDGSAPATTVQVTLSESDVNEFIPVSGLARNDVSTAYEQSDGSVPTPSQRAAIGNALVNDDRGNGPVSVTSLRSGSVEGQGISIPLGQTFAGLYGTFRMDGRGAFSYELDNSNPVVDSLPAGGTLTETFNYTMSNGTWTDTATVTILIVGENDAPSLTNPGIMLESAPNTGISEMPSGQMGLVVNTVLTTVGANANVADVDTGATIGFAITSADDTSGQWWFSQDDGVTWDRMGSVSDAQPRLLSPTARIYFRPERNIHGQVAQTLGFRAWDQSRGSAGQLASRSALGNSLSTQSGSIAVNVQADNATTINFAQSSAVVLAAAAGNVMVMNSTGTTRTVRGVSDGATVTIIGDSPTVIDAPVGSLIIARGSTGIVTVQGMVPGSTLQLDTSFGRVQVASDGRLMSQLTPFQLLSLSRVLKVNGPGNFTVRATI